MYIIINILKNEDTIKVIIGLTNTNRVIITNIVRLSLSRAKT